ncbi:Cytosolic carboxypeptidase 2, partial [Aduncisulcus paluster]
MDEDKTICFSASFECGNLIVNNIKKDQIYNFSIVNLTKKDSLYNKGMKPLTFSRKAHKNTGIGWHRCGTNVLYYQNEVKRGTNPLTGSKGSSSSKHLSTLSFNYKGEYDDDTVFFAHCFPYSYSDLQEFLQKIVSSPQSHLKIRKRPLCKTVGGNVCDLLTITDFSSSSLSLSQRPCVFISARIHPGETNSSWMMHGLIEELLSDSPEAKKARKMFLFKIIPMLNPDGVIAGNYRCNLCGYDLNRNWSSKCDSDKHPTIYHLKQLMTNLAKEGRKLWCYIDLHGHSKAMDVFSYGCSLAPPHSLKEWVFPRLIESRNIAFNCKKCKFVIKKGKEGTGRVVAFKELGVMFSYTIEASFCGQTRGGGKGMHFTPQALKDIGRDICKTISFFSFSDPIFRAEFEQVVIEVKEYERIAQERSEKLAQQQAQLLAEKAQRKEEEGEKASASSRMGSSPVILSPSSSISRLPHSTSDSHLPVSPVPYDKPSSSFSGSRASKGSKPTRHTRTPSSPTSGYTEGSMMVPSLSDTGDISELTMTGVGMVLSDASASSAMLRDSERLSGLEGSDDVDDDDDVSDNSSSEEELCCADTSGALLSVMQSFSHMEGAGVGMKVRMRELIAQEAKKEKKKKDSKKKGKKRSSKKKD